MSLSWFVAQLSWQRPGFWILFSFLAGLALLVGGRHLSPSRYRLVGMARWVIIPYTGLVLGALSPRFMGLTDINWATGLGLGLGLIFAVAVLLVLIRTTIALDQTNSLPAGSNEGRFSLATTVAGVVAAGAEEFHWTFLRGAVWETLLFLPTRPELPHYWAIWIAALLAVPEILVQRHTVAQRLIWHVLLVTTTILFFYTRNFWLCWTLHAGARWLLLPYRDELMVKPQPVSGEH